MAAVVWEGIGAETGEASFAVADTPPHTHQCRVASLRQRCMACLQGTHSPGHQALAPLAVLLRFPAAAGGDGDRAAGSPERHPNRGSDERRH